MIKFEDKFELKLYKNKRPSGVDRFTIKRKSDGKTIESNVPANVIQSTIDKIELILNS